MEHRWNEIDRGTRVKTCPSATFFTTNPTCTDLGSNPGLRGWTVLLLPLDSEEVYLKILLIAKLIQY
jgi:hypothetical protein